VSRQALPARDHGVAYQGRESMVRSPIKLVRNATTGQPDFDAMANLNEPVVPNFSTSTSGNLRGNRSEPAAADFGGDSSYLDIPAFLRRQAD
jgi:cell division protein FtsZ